MGWKGFARAMNRAAVRHQRELQRQQKLIAKMQEAEKAAYEVQVYENYIDLLLSVHKECGEPYDWAEIGRSEPATRYATFTHKMKINPKSTYCQNYQ